MDSHIGEFQDKDLSIKLEINSSFSPFQGSGLFTVSETVYPLLYRLIS